MTGRTAGIHSLRLQALAAWLSVIPLGFAAKFYRGPGQWWLNNWGSSLAYVAFFVLLGFMAVPRRGAIVPIAAGVCVVTCTLEVAQAWKPPFLQAARSTFVGQSLLGNSFSWWDFPAYPVGCLLGALFLRRMVAWNARHET